MANLNRIGIMNQPTTYFGAGRDERIRGRERGGLKVLMSIFSISLKGEYTFGMDSKLRLTHCFVLPYKIITAGAWYIGLLIDYRMVCEIMQIEILRGEIFNR